MNLIGEHTDYQQGFVFPIAIDKQTAVAVSLTNTNTYRLYSDNLQQLVEFETLPTSPPASPSWWCYVLGPMVCFCDHVGFKMPKGLDICVVSDVPLGGGLSSSAALVSPHICVVPVGAVVSADVA